MFYVCDHTPNVQTQGVKIRDSVITFCQSSHLRLGSLETRQIETQESIQWGGET